MTLAYSRLWQLSTSPYAVHKLLAITLTIAAVIGAVVLVVAMVRGICNAPEHLRYKACASLSISLAFLAIGCSTLVFVPPWACALLMLLISGAGTVLAVISFRQLEPIGATWLRVVGFLVNTSVQVFAVVLFWSGALHVFDRIERTSPTLLKTINCSALVSALLLVGILVWLSFRQRHLCEQRFQFRLSSLLLTFGAALLWLWLSLAQAVPHMILEGRLGRPDLSDLAQIILDFGIFGTINVVMTPLVLYALAHAVHLLVFKFRDAWPISAMAAGMLLMLTPLIVGWARRPPTSDNRVVRMCHEIAHGAATGLNLSDRDGFGGSVASLGDMDGDGVTDLAVGAAGTDESYIKYRLGAVYVLLMNADGTVKQSRKISSSSGGGPSLTTGSLFGSSMASIGDLDGDGVTDLAVGAPGDRTGGRQRGAVYILMMDARGTAREFRKIASGIGGGPDLADSDGFGRSVASLGDLNGDGVTDLAVGASGDHTSGTTRGAVYVLMMNASGTVANFQKVANGTGGGPPSVHGDRFGASLAALGDIDGDDVTDLVVSAMNPHSRGRNQTIHMLLMHANGTVKRSQQIISDVAGRNAVAKHDRFGSALASLGDLDGDRITDLAVGAPGDNTGGFSRGIVYVLLMNGDGTVKRAERITSGSGGPKLTDAAHFGRSIAPLGDLNGDGNVDLAVGAVGDGSGTTKSGAIHIVFLKGVGADMDESKP